MVRLEASANHSSEKERMREPRGLERRSAEVVSDYSVHLGEWGAQTNCAGERGIDFVSSDLGDAFRHNCFLSKW